MSKRYLRLIVDAAMFGLMLALLSYPLTRGLLPHGVMGMAFTGLVLFHHGLNLAWYKSLFRGRWTGERVLVTITDTGLLFATIALVASSLVMAGEVFSFAPFAMPWWGRGLDLRALLRAPWPAHRKTSELFAKTPRQGLLAHGLRTHAPLHVRLLAERHLDESPSLGSPLKAARGSCPLHPAIPWRGPCPLPSGPRPDAPCTQKGLCKRMTAPNLHRLRMPHS